MIRYMYNILLVDDEPWICKGLSNLLTISGLHIHNIFIAQSGYEAMDFIRMEDIDLLITDIQMSGMSGIELMHQAKMEKPSVQSIVVSAHETFQYAQLAMRLGAKDYLIKPINSTQFLDSVRSVLLRLTKTWTAKDEIAAPLNERFSMSEPAPATTALLNSLLANPVHVCENAFSAQQLRDLSLVGPYFAVLKINLHLQSPSNRERFFGENVHLLQYAVLNMANELLEGQFSHIAFCSPDYEITIILQWDSETYGDPGINKINQLDIIGRLLCMNIQVYLSLQCVIGISHILQGIEYISVLDQQAKRAVRLNHVHPDHYVFYYGDFCWNQDEEEPKKDELNMQSNQIVDKVKKYIHEHFAQKGLTLLEIAHKSHVSPNYLSYLFKKITGYNLWDYVVKLRMEESRLLLTTTDLRRYEIAEKVGYESPEHFSKIFKKYYGVSLSEFKK